MCKPTGRIKPKHQNGCFEVNCEKNEQNSKVKLRNVGVYRSVGMDMVNTILQFARKRNVQTRHQGRHGYRYGSFYYFNMLLLKMLQC